MRVEATELPGVLYVQPRVFADHRGAFLETFRESRYAEEGMIGPWVQDNLSVSRRGVLRGLHLQWPAAQGKLVSAVRGLILDVAVDVRRSSPHYGAWVARELSGERRDQLWVPPGFAHGFAVLSEEAVVSYKCTGHAYTPGAEVSIRWDSPTIGIRWRVEDPILARRDADAPVLAALPPSRLPPE